MYADWLEERGDPRAEFIRVQIQMENEEEWSPEYLKLRSRANKIANEYVETWEQSFPSFIRERYLPPIDFSDVIWNKSKYRRGFLNHIEFLCDEFIDDAGRVFSAAPIQSIEICNIQDGGEALAACPQLRHAHHLFLRFHETQPDLDALLGSQNLRQLDGLSLDLPLGDSPTPTQQAVIIVGIARLWSLNSLDLARNGIDSSGLRTLVTSRQLSNLKRLSVQGNPIDDNGLKSLSDSGLLERLTHVDLQFIQSGDEGYEAFARAQPKCLEHLAIGRLPRAGIGERGLIAIANCSTLSTLRKLNLWHSPLSEESVKAFAQSTCLENVSYLDLSSTEFNDEMANELAQTPFLRQLHYLDLQNNEIGSEGITAIVNARFVNAVTYLSLYANPGIGDTGAKAIADSENLRSLQYLMMTSTGIGTEGIEAIARSPNLPELRTFGIEKATIGPAAAKALIESPHLEKISNLDLQNCEIDEEYIQPLRERFGTALLDSFPRKGFFPSPLGSGEELPED